MPSAAEPNVLLATRSHDKAREIRNILGAAFGRIISLDEAGIAETPGEADIEVFDTFIDNARAKADYFMQRAGIPTLADDSGISIHALGGAPGVRSRRFAGRPDLAGTALDHANNEHLLRALEGVPMPQRSAHYSCAAVLHLPDGRRFAAIGTCSGLILTAPRGPHGFGYDPLFLDTDTGLSFGETAAALKNARSHRSRAFRALLGTSPAFQ
jgi:XTP/dITP diphosphohydrolase